MIKLQIGLQITKLLQDIRFIHTSAHMHFEEQQTNLVHQDVEY